MHRGVGRPLARRWDAARAATRRLPIDRSPRTQSCSRSSRRSPPAVRPARWSARSSARGTAAAAAEGGWVVVVDPIDGSLNAKRGLPFLCLAWRRGAAAPSATSASASVRDLAIGEAWVGRARRGRDGGRPPARRGAAARSRSRSCSSRRRRGPAGRAADGALQGARARAGARLAGPRALPARRGPRRRVATLAPTRAVDIAAAQLIVPRPARPSSRPPRTAPSTGCRSTSPAARGSRCRRRDERRRLAAWSTPARRTVTPGGRTCRRGHLEQIRAALVDVIDPELRRDLVELRMVREMRPRADGDVARRRRADGARLPAEGEASRATCAARSARSRACARVAVRFTHMTAEERADADRAAARQRAAASGEGKSIGRSTHARHRRRRRQGRRRQVVA